MATTSVINLVNTGTAINSGNGDSLRTAFNKVNGNFLALEATFVAAGVTSFNSQTGIITFTATDISNILGFVPYNASNPNNYVTQAAINGLATEVYVNETFVTTATFYSMYGSYITSSTFFSYVQGLATEQWVLDKDYATVTRLQNALSASLGSYVTTYYLTDNGYITTSTINTYFDDRFASLTNIIPGVDATYYLGTPAKRWKEAHVSDSITLGGAILNGSTTTTRLYVNGQVVNPSADFEFSSNKVTNPRTFLIVASTWSSTGAVIELPSMEDAHDFDLPLRIQNTWTGGITLVANTATLEVAGNRVTLSNGVINAPVTFQGEPGTNKLQIIDAQPYITLPGGNGYGKLDRQLEIAAIDSAETRFSALKIKATDISIIPLTTTYTYADTNSDSDVHRLGILAKDNTSTLRVVSMIVSQTNPDAPIQEKFFRPIELGGSSVRIGLYSTASVSPSVTQSVGWQFHAPNGNTSQITFPDGTVQYTAFQTTSVPVHSYGVVGDKAGMISADSNYFYYCISNYVNNTTNIWKRIAWSASTW